MKIKTLLTSTIFFLVLKNYAQAPAGYYNSASGLTGAALKTALHNIIDNHTVISYGNLYTAFATTDMKANNKIWDMYSDIPGGTPPYEFSNTSADQCGNYNSEADCFNREHSWPQSWFNGVSPAYSDLFHLYPTDGYVNNRRGNSAYGEVANPTWTSLNGSKVGPNTSTGFSGVVFEPIDAYKGDLARGYFYMSTRYQGEDSGWSTSDATNKSTLEPWAVCLLLNWHHQDTVSTKEVNRNNAVYALQNNRNPFIDHPEWADSIFTCTLNPTNVVKNVQDHVLSFSTFPNPAHKSLNVVFSKEISADLVFYDFIGKQVYTQHLISTSLTNVDCSTFAKGVYILQLNTGTEFLQKKIVVE